MMFLIFRQLKQIKKLARQRLSLILFLTLANCTIGSYPDGALSKLISQPLSLTRHGLRTCIFDSHHLIAHFPMLHFPPGGHYTPEIFEQVTMSQFQLLHTVIDYSRSTRRQLILFDEHINSDLYGPRFFQSLTSGQTDNTWTRIDGKQFHLSERMQTAKTLFPQIPRYYEHLSLQQKELIFNIGASMVLFLLGAIPEIHKVISQEKFNLVLENLRGPDGQINLEGNDYWRMDFRELALKTEVLGLIQKIGYQNKIFLIAYGSAHDFSNEFAGYSFQSGHNFCLEWQNPTGFSPPLT